MAEMPTEDSFHRWSAGPGRPVTPMSTLGAY